jgi:hypothetical protein
LSIRRVSPRPSKTCSRILLADEGHRRRFADAGYDKALSAFTSDRTTDEIERLYRSVVQPDDQPSPLRN